MIRFCGMILGLAALAGCAAPPPSQADQADAAACTAAADATYNAQNYDQLSRTSQTGLFFAPTPNHVFDAQQQGAMHVRDSQISTCETQGNAAANGGSGGPFVTPRIVTSP